MGEGEGNVEDGRRRRRRGSEDDNDGGGGGGDGVDTGSAMTVTMATMVTAMTMTRLNVCDASTEEKERPSNPSRMHATIKYTREQEQRG